MPALELPENTLGRDFVVSDVHGHFARLEEALDAQAFDPARDRLISVGDLIDRGPQSPRALEFLAQPWFFSVRGNHEQAMLDWITLLLAGVPAEELRESVMRHAMIGGDWALPMLNAGLRGDLDDIRRWQAALAAIPLAVVVPRRGQRNGIVHASVPGGDWDAFSEHDDQPGVVALAQWSRRPIDDSSVPGSANAGVHGMDRVFLGHNVVPAPQRFANLRLIETGAWQGHPLTLVDLDSEADAAAKKTEPFASRLQRWFRRDSKA